VPVAHIKEGAVHEITPHHRHHQQGADDEMQKHPCEWPMTERQVALQGVNSSDDQAAIPAHVAIHR